MAVTERPADVVGIDLGTTHCAAAFVEGASIAAGEPVVQSFPIPQLVREGELEERPVLPSCVYLAREGELPPGSLALPWEPPAADEAVGTLALELGGRVPGRLVTSAKSWLCHAQVDRTQAILPWGGSGERRLSPVEASARYLDHVRRAWNHARAAADPAARLEAQEVVLTVPASFDEAARELTVAAARAAGLEHVTLLEEPQAALYAWIHRGRGAWQDEVRPDQVLLVVDVGGGTTDLSLVRVGQAGDGKPTLERFAVGRHLMLGGDNMDLALAHLVEAKLGGGGLDAGRWQHLVQRCRAAKETLLAGGAERVRIEVLGAGSSVIGGTRTAELERGEVDRLIVDGFAPEVGLDEPLREAEQGGLQELGLPYEADPAITRLSLIHI